MRGLPEVVLGGMLVDHVRWAFNAGLLIRGTDARLGPANSANTDSGSGSAPRSTDRARTWRRPRGAARRA